MSICSIVQGIHIVPRVVLIQCVIDTLYLCVCSLIGNKMGDKGAEAISLGMSTMVNLQKLR